MVEKGYAYAGGRGRLFPHPEGSQITASSPTSLWRIWKRALGSTSASKRRTRLDFALWKAAKPGEPCWDSPWGKGRPGWHIECSAMARRYLGNTIDIHCGGQDLIFPHHENEIAQSGMLPMAVHFAHYWMHNGYINVDNRKMSKSLGNFFTVRDVAAQVGYEPIRYLMISSHYRSPINYSAEYPRAGGTRAGAALQLPGATSILRSAAPPPMRRDGRTGKL